MARKKKSVKALEEDVVLGASNSSMFQIDTHPLNEIKTESATNRFPGNINPEGYFYSPFYEVKIKELDDDLQYSVVKRINFVPSSATVSSSLASTYDPARGGEIEKELYEISITSPVPYDLIGGQPFCIYDILNDKTYRGHLSSLSGLEVKIVTDSEISQEGLDGTLGSGRSQYIISFLTENVPDYAEFLPSSQRLVWRGVKKMSELSNDSPLYNMPFTNGRNYIQQNVNVFVRRQDPQNDFKLFRPSPLNPLRGYQVEGKGKIDFDYVGNIIDSVINPC